MAIILACQDCGEMAAVKPVIPKRHNDGKHRCPLCWKRRHAEITQSWKAAATAYTPEMNRGGQGLPLPKEAA